MRSVPVWLFIVAVVSALCVGADGEPKGRDAESAPTSQPTTRPDPIELRIGEITEEHKGRLVSVTAEVDQVLEKPSRTRERIHIVTLVDGDEKIELIIWADVAKTIPPKRWPREGDRIRVVGKVTEFRKRLQITLEVGDDLRKLKKKPVAE